MARILFFLVIMVLALRANAQNQNPDMPFNINFSPLTNSLPDSAMSGLANYYRVEQPILPGITPAYTNRLEVFINLSDTPDDAWILEKEKDGSLTKLFEVTNLLSYGSFGSYYLQFDQFFTLTTNQIHSLIEGNWYAEVDFGDSNYLGNLSPDYGFASGPTAAMTFPPVPAGYDTNVYMVISPNNRTATFVFDGSHCTDPFYLPMDYSWTGWAGGFLTGGTPYFTASGEFPAQTFGIGTYIITLQASDAISTGAPFYFYMNVITAGQAVDSLISEVQEFGFTENQEAILVRHLSSAAAQFNRGNMVPGCLELEAYEQTLAALNLGDTITSYLMQPAQNIIDSLSSSVRLPPGLTGRFTQF